MRVIQAFRRSATSSRLRGSVASCALGSMRSQDERLQADAAAASRAAANAPSSSSAAAAVASETIFDQIIRKQIPAKIVYEDDQCLAFHDVNPQAPVHLLVIPKTRDGLTQLALAEERHKTILGHLLYIAKLVAQQQQLDKGFRIVINDGDDGCQSVFHLHLHVLGGRKLGWPPG